LIEPTHNSFAAHGHTAAEVIYERADAEKPFMGLTSFSGEVPVFKDVGIAKNYLTENELKVLNNLVSGYVDIAEINALEHKPMYMDDYVKQLDAVLGSGNRKLLIGTGEVSQRTQGTYLLVLFLAPIHIKKTHYEYKRTKRYVPMVSVV
jgi:hypothetical protein